MVFNSLYYFTFLPLVWLVFAIVGDKYRWLVLLVSSFVFYGFILKPILLLVLMAVIIFTFIMGRLVDRVEQPASRLRLLWVGIVLNLGILVYFKYIPFITENVNLLLRVMNVGLVLADPHPLVSIGLSFYIFQAISYLVDIYFKTAKPEPHLGYFGLYLSFFAKLLQGPIERAGDLIPQLKKRYNFSYCYNDVRQGVLLFSWGLFKKMVVADRLGAYVDNVYSDVHAFSGFALLFATYCYAFQIYMDFSGYTDMALGSARIFNIELTQNFNAPYSATSISEFWRRWHISFSRWILDYIFEPLQMALRGFGKWGAVGALLVTFVLAGIWHGASWTFVAFGLIHGVYLGSALLYKPYKKKLYKYLGIEKSGWLGYWQIAITFHLVCFSWIFFRAMSLGDVAYILREIAFDFRINRATISETILPFSGNNSSINYLFTILFVGVLYLVLKSQLVARRTFLYLVMVSLGVLFLGKFDTAVFLYMGY